MIKWFRESMRHKLTYNGIKVSGRKIFSCTKNAPLENSIVVIFAIIVIVALGNIGQVEIIGAQTDTTNMNPMVIHIHPQLSVLVGENSLTVPAQIGIDPSLWKDHTLDEFGMQSMPEMNMSAMSPLHTHDNSGIIHVESMVNRNYTLEEFLNIWGLNIGDKTVELTVNGKPITDFRNHILSDGEEIRLAIQ